DPGFVVIAKMRIPVSIVTLFVCGCATPKVVYWDAPNPWKTDPGLSPPATLPPPVAPSSGTQFASDAVLPAGATDPIPAAPDPPVPQPTEPPKSDAPAVGANLGETQPPKDPNFKLRGRIEADSITVSQSPKDKLLFGDFQDAVGFRRLRLGAEGTAGEM